MKLWRLIERYEGKRFVYVYADTKADALREARAGNDIDASDDPHHFNYRYAGPVVEAPLLTRALLTREQS